MRNIAHVQCEADALHVIVNDIMHRDKLKSAQEIADELGITKQKVYRLIGEANDHRRLNGEASTIARPNTPGGYYRSVYNSISEAESRRGLKTQFKTALTHANNTRADLQLRAELTDEVATSKVYEAMAKIMEYGDVADLLMEVLEANENERAARAGV